VVSGIPAFDNREWLRSTAAFRRLGDMQRTLRTLEARLAAMERDRARYVYELAPSFFGVEENGEGVSQALIDWAFALTMQSSPRAAAEMLRTNFLTDQRGKLKEIRIPTLIVHGEPGLDHVTGMGGTAEYARRIANARAVSLERTGQSRAGVTDAKGDFQFTSLLPDRYTVRVEMSSFRTVERKGNVLTSAERLSVGTLKLTIGLGESLVVEAVGAQVNTSDSQHSGLIAAKQITDQVRRS